VEPVLCLLEVERIPRVVDDVARDPLSPIRWAAMLKDLHDLLLREDIGVHETPASEEP
jgi:hypothetical protein